MENISSDDQLDFEYDTETIHLLCNIKPFIEDYNEIFFDDISDKVENLNDVNMIEKLISTYKETESKRLFNHIKQSIEEYKKGIFNSIHHDLELFKTIQNQFDSWILKNQLNENDKIDFLWQSPLSIIIEDYTESNEQIIERWLTLYDTGKTIHFFMKQSKKKGYNTFFFINRPHRSYEAFLMIKCSCGEQDEDDIIYQENINNVNNNDNSHDKTIVDVNQNNYNSDNTSIINNDMRICKECLKYKEYKKFNIRTYKTTIKNGKTPYEYPSKVCSACRRRKTRLNRKNKNVNAVHYTDMKI